MNNLFLAGLGLNLVEVGLKKINLTQTFTTLVYIHLN